MAIVFETERLVARHWDPESDAEAALAMYGDAEVMRYLGREPQVVGDVEEMTSRLRKIVDLYTARDNGTGGWALADKASGEVIGSVLVKHLPDADGNPTEDLEVGWHLRRSAWGRGFATEAGKAGIDYAFGTLGVATVYAVIYAENVRSIAVAQRLEMTHRGPTDRYYGVTVELFEKRRA